MLVDLIIGVGIPRQFAGDVLVGLVYALFTIILIYLVKKENLGAFLVSVYISYAIIAVMFFEFAQSPVVKVLVFVVLLFFLFSFFKGHIRVRIKGANISMWIKILLLALSVVGLIASVVLQWLPSAMLQEFFIAFSSDIFSSDQARLVWMIIPLALIFVFRSRL